MKEKAGGVDDGFASELDMEFARAVERYDRLDSSSLSRTKRYIFEGYLKEIRSKSQADDLKQEFIQQLKNHEYTGLRDSKVQR